MKSNKILIILCIVTTLIVFIISFIVTNNLINISENNKIAEKDSIQDNNKNEIIQENNMIYEKETNFFEGIIISIERNNVVVENPSHLVDYSIYEGDMNWHNEHHVVVDGKLCVTASYLLCLDNVQIKDKSGNEISVSNLKIGDAINVFTENVRYTESTISAPITSDHIKLIEKEN